jgi:deoxyribodipyrimidine photo-lyase
MRGVAVPASRIRILDAAPPRADRDYVLYWMIAARRPRWNFALDRAAELARELGRPLLVFEALRCDYRWASDRHHRFVIDGMADNAAAFAGRVTYLPYVEPWRGAGKGLLEALAARAAAVITDAFPGFFLPRMVAAAATRLGVHFEEVDGNGLLPLAAAPRAFERAVDFRRFLQRELASHLGQLPSPASPRTAACEVPADVLQRWPPADLGALRRPGGLASLPIDHRVAAVGMAGGEAAAAAMLSGFVEHRLARYGERRDVEHDVGSGLSPYLHFGHVSTHRILAAIADRERWSPARLGDAGRGERQGWWGMSEAAEGFLDQLVTWRELGFNFAAHRADHERWESLPEWARRTLAAHEPDARPELYDLAELESAATGDALWNAAQSQLLREGAIHNYLRMLWGKKILEWSPSPQAALERMVQLNNRWALDGRDPNSYTGILWCLGRHDRPWAPERPIFGSVRYMSSANTARKMNVKGYLRRFSPAGPPLFE